MGVLMLQILVCGQLILFSLAVEDTTYPLQTTESQNKPSTTAPPLKTTGNDTENNASTLSNNSTYNSSSTNLTASTSQTTSARPQSTTWNPRQNNDTVTGSTIQPNTTTAHTTQSTVSVNSTAFTSQYNTTYSRTTVKLTAVTKTTQKAVTHNSTDFTIRSFDSGLSHSEKSLTVLFSVLLGVIVLIILVYSVHKFSKRKQTSIQYIHRRLQNEDSGEQFAVSDDTLIISGGLYDSPQIYNPSMTVQNEEDFQTDAPGIPDGPTQFRLEFLREDQGRTCDTFQENDQEP